MKKFKISFLFAFLVFTIFYIYAYTKGATFSFLRDKEEIVETEETLPKEDIGNIEDGNTVEQKYEKELFFLLLGVDSDDVNSKVATRSDTMILCKVNFETGKITMMNLPRDSRVPVRGSLTKLNHAHAYGGTSLLLKTIRDFTNLDLDYYVKVDYRVVEYLVDAIGGVQFDVPLDMVYSDPTAKPQLKINIKKGMQTITKDNVVGLLRFRHNNDFSVQYPNGDIGRIATQQAFMKEAIKQTLTLSNIPKLPIIIKNVLKMVDTNFSGKQLLNAARGASKLDVNNIETVVLPGYGATLDDGISYYVLKDNEVKEIIKNNFGEYLKNAQNSN